MVLPIECFIVSGLTNSNKKRLARKADSLSQKVQEHGEFPSDIAQFMKSMPFDCNIYISLTHLSVD